jgi:hypothetical protein
VTETTTSPPVPQEDNLANDLLNMLAKHGIPPAQQQALMIELVPYLVDRDHKVFTHAYDAGRASA